MKLQDILSKAIDEAAKERDAKGCDGNCEGCSHGETDLDTAFSAQLDDLNENVESATEMVAALAAVLMNIAKHHDMEATAKSAFDIWMKCKRD